MTTTTTTHPLGWGDLLTPAWPLLAAATVILVGMFAWRCWRRRPTTGWYIDIDGHISRTRVRVPQRIEPPAGARPEVIWIDDLEDWPPVPLPGWRETRLGPPPDPQTGPHSCCPKPARAGRKDQPAQDSSAEGETV